jgi:hypothetical protein
MSAPARATSCLASLSDCARPPGAGTGGDGRKAALARIGRTRELLQARMGVVEAKKRDHDRTLLELSMARGARGSLQAHELLRLKGALARRRMCMGSLERFQQLLLTLENTEMRLQDAYATQEAVQALQRGSAVARVQSQQLRAADIDGILDELAEAEAQLNDVAAAQAQFAESMGVSDADAQAELRVLEASLEDSFEPRTVSAARGAIWERERGHNTDTYPLLDAMETRVTPAPGLLAGEVPACDVISFESAQRRRGRSSKKSAAAAAVLFA